MSDMLWPWGTLFWKDCLRCIVWMGKTLKKARAQLFPRALKRQETHIVRWEIENAAYTYVECPKIFKFDDSQYPVVDVRDCWPGTNSGRFLDIRNGTATSELVRIVTLRLIVRIGENAALAVPECERIRTNLKACCSIWDDRSDFKLLTGIE